MSLHKTIEFTRKFLIGILLGVAAVFIFILIFRLGIIVKNLLFPPKITPANHLYGTLPKITFPQSTTNTKFTYTINTVSGELPKFPDRLNVYPIKQQEPSFLNLDKVKKKTQKLDFTTDGRLVPETVLDEVTYEWKEDTGIRRSIIFNTVTFDFTLKSSFLSSLTVINAKELSNEKSAKKTVTSFLNLINQMPDDIDLNKTYIQFLSIKNDALVPAASLSNTQVIRVDLHQKNIAYDLNTGIPLTSGGFKKTKISLPILYPNPPYSTMSFWIASGQSRPEVVAANFKYKSIDFDQNIESTYAIKTATEAFEELKNGKAYIASYNGSQNEININKVYLGYYLDESSEEYLQPIVVFEGEDGFTAYVFAVKDEWVE